MREKVKAAVPQDKIFKSYAFCTLHNTMETPANAIVLCLHFKMTAFILWKTCNSNNRLPFPKTLLCPISDGRQFYFQVKRSKWKLTDSSSAVDFYLSISSQSQTVSVSFLSGRPSSLSFLHSLLGFNVTVFSSICFPINLASFPPSRSTSTGQDLFKEASHLQIIGCSQAISLGNFAPSFQRKVSDRG